MERYDPYTDKFIKDATDKNVGTKISRETLELARAIDGLTEWQKHVQTDSNIDRDITVAIKALKAQLGTNLAEVDTDTISRQSAIDALCTLCTACGRDCDKSKFVYNAPQDEQVILCPEHYALSMLPPAQPEQRTGKWVYHIDDLFPAESTQECDQCHSEQPLACDDNYCPNCGAKMEGDAE